MFVRVKSEGAMSTICASLAPTLASSLFQAIVREHERCKRTRHPFDISGRIIHVSDSVADNDDNDVDVDDDEDDD